MIRRQQGVPHYMIVGQRLSRGSSLQFPKCFTRLTRKTKYIQLIPSFPDNYSYCATTKHDNYQLLFKYITYNKYIQLSSKNIYINNSYKLEIVGVAFLSLHCRKSRHPPQHRNYAHYYSCPASASLLLT